MSNSMIQKTQAGTGNLKSSSTPTNGRNTASTSRHPKGKSQYAQKSRSKKNRKPVAVKRGPVNAYTSACCGVPATKKPCVAVSKKDALTQTLGKFRCGGCGKRAKVTVSKFKAPETVTVQAPAMNGVPMGESITVEVLHD